MVKIQGKRKIGKEISRENIKIKKIKEKVIVFVSIFVMFCFFNMFSNEVMGYSVIENLETNTHATTFSSSQTIEDGIYELETGVDSNKVVEVVDASQVGGANVQIFEKNNGECQKVKIKYVSNGYYTISFVHSNKMLDVYYGLSKNHTNVWQCSPNGSDAQLWRIEETQDGYYNIISKCGDLYLTVANRLATNCTNIEIANKTYGFTQTFRLNKVEKITGQQTIADGTYEIQTALNTNKVIEVADASQAGGANVQLFERNNGNCQSVNVKYVGNGYYTIEFVHSRKMLDVYYARVENRTNVWQCSPNGSDAQKWVIKQTDDGYYNIVSKCSNTYLTVANGRISNCTNIEINSKKENSSQKFKFVQKEKITGQQTIADGTYEIQTALDSNKVLDVLNASQQGGANVQIYTRNNSLCQSVDVSYVGNGYYTMEFNHSGKMLDVYYARVENRTNVWQCSPNGSDAQKWVIKQTDDGYYNIISKCSNTYLTVANGNSANCTNVEINTKREDINNGMLQKFKFVEKEKITPAQTIESGVYEIETAVDSSKVLDVLNASRTSGGNVQIYSKNNSRCQKVAVDCLSDGYYVLTFLHSGMVLDVANGNTNNGTNVWQCKENYTDAQKWVIRKTEDGYYNIISKTGEKYLTVENGKTSNCTNIEINSKKGQYSNSQKFKFNKLQEFNSYPCINSGIYEIETFLNSSKVLDVDGASKAGGANIQLYERNGGDCQKVYAKEIENGLYTFELLNSNKFLDVKDGGYADGTNVIQWNENGSVAQMWAIRSCHDGYYEIVAKCNGKNLTVANGSAVNCSNLEINSKYDNWKKYFAQKFKFNSTKYARYVGTYGSSGLVYQGNSNGSSLKYYKYGNGQNVLFATFAVHGFEDNWYRDGQALTQIAERLYNKLIDDSDRTIAKNWTVYIFPSVNPDGEYHGTTNSGPGRRTFFSMAPNCAGIDINRCWQSSGMSFKMYTDSRNYNGTQGFQAYEALALKNFMLQNKTNTGTNVVIDLHGWENSLIGDSSVLDYYAGNFPTATRKYGSYGQQYLISWARTDLGAKVGLVELPNWIYSMQDVANNDLYNKYINSTINMLKDMSVRTYAQDNTKTNYVITDEEQFEVALTGVLKDSEKAEKVVARSGIYVGKEIDNSQNVLELINDLTNVEYYLDEDGFMTFEKSSSVNNKYDDFIQKLINSNKTYIFTSLGKIYFKDVVTGDIVTDDYEDLECYQTYNYASTKDNILIDFNTNKEKKLTKEQILDSVIQLVEKGWENV